MDRFLTNISFCPSSAKGRLCLPEAERFDDRRRVWWKCESERLILVSGLTRSKLSIRIVYWNPLGFSREQSRFNTKRLWCRGGIAGLIPACLLMCGSVVGQNTELHIGPGGGGVTLLLHQPLGWKQPFCLFSIMSNPQNCGKMVVSSVKVELR